VTQTQADDHQTNSKVIAMHERDEEIVQWLNGVRPHAAVAEAIPPERPFTLTPALARFLGRLVIDGGRRRIVEFGAGASSRVFAAALSHVGGGQLTSVEESPKWCSEAWSDVERTPGVDARLIVSPLVRRTSAHGPMFVYRGIDAALSDRGPFDLALIDGPQGCFGRDGSLLSVLPLLSPGAVVILDDAGRWKERATLRRWLATIPAMTPVAIDNGFGGRGVAVLRLAGEPRVRVSPSVFVSRAVSDVINWQWRLRHRAAVSPAAA
jgi:predicted O-methyltransferase YrrM